MKKKTMGKLFGLVSLGTLLLGGCGTTATNENTSATESSAVLTSESQTELEAETVEEEGKEDMSIKVEENQGELLQNTEELKNDATELIIDMDSVSDVICPNKYSDKRADVLYGKLEHITYYSTTTACDRKANILLPADYDPDKQYPVLYFLHGIFGDENSMIGDPNNRLNEIVNNMKKDGLIGDVIIVFPHMYATGNPDLKPGFSAEQTAPYDNFINDLTQDLIPYIEENYSVLTDRENRGIIGFSMGGRETLYIGCLRSDLFAYIGAISPAPGVVPAKDWAMEHPGQMKEEEFVIRMEDYQPKLFMITCGTKDSVVGTYPASYDAILTKNGVKHLWYEVPEADHDSNAIKSGFFNFLLRWQPGK